MNIPCPNHVLCPPDFIGQFSTLEFDSPLANFSSEAPDQDLFIGLNYGWDVNQPNIGWSFNNGNLVGLCTSPVSQAAADQCALNQQLNNTVNGGPGNIPDHPWTGPTGQPIQTFQNQQQACSHVCPDGLLFTWVIGPGAVNALSLQIANAIAFASACQQASAHFICLGSLTATATVGTQYTSVLSTTLGPLVKLPLSIGISSGSLPPGLLTAQSADSKSFIVSGTPTTPGTFNFTVQATDANGNFMQKAFTITVSGSCPSVFANPSWNITFSTPPNPPFSNASGSASGLSFSLESDSNGLVVPVQSNADFGVNGPELPYTLGIALTCKLTVTFVGSPISNNAVVLNARLQDNSIINLFTLAPAPGGTSVTSLTIPANTKSLIFAAAVVGGNGVGGAGSATMNGTFGS